MPVRVVIAEDEAIIRLDLKEILQEEGYDVVGETGRGDEAIQLVRTLGPELVILDIKMPGTDGLSAAREITGERLAAVVILTAFSQRDLVDQARDAGVLAYVVKPFQKSDLLPQIEIALGRFREIQNLAHDVKSLEDQLETRRVVERAKGMLMDELQHEGGASRSAGSRRRPCGSGCTMKEIARRVIEDGLRPPRPPARPDDRADD